MEQPIKRIAFLFIMLCIPILLFYAGEPRLKQVAKDPGPVSDKSLPEKIDRLLASRFPASTFFRQMNLDLKMAGGLKEHNGIYLSKNGLMKKLDPPVGPLLEANIQALDKFSEYCSNLDVPVYFAVIPSASGVMLQDLPRFSTTWDQSRVIDSIYANLSGKLTAIHLYPVLEQYSNHDIYMRTQDMPTSYGGYLVYNEMVGKLLGKEPSGLELYDIRYQAGQYYGDLYRAAPYSQVRPDILATYHFNAYAREYLVEHTAIEGSRVYHSLYPTQALSLNQPMDLYLGGQSAVVEIKTTALNHRKLLLFGDKTAFSYLPFLANHYKQITFIDLFHSESLYSHYLVQDYSQVMFAYGMESFSATANPTRVTALIRE